MKGTLWLVPNALDLGAEPVPLEDVLPLGVIRRASGLRHWVVEDARSARAFLKRVHAVAPLLQPLQSLEIIELPRPPKGAARRPARVTRCRAAQWAITCASDVPAARTPCARAREGDTAQLTASGASTPWHELLAPALAGHDLGLLSEAGLPAVADPGAALVAAAHAAGITVQALPGASSLLLALAASGLDGQQFAFVGYLPQEADARAARLRVLEARSRELGQTQVCIETPYRNGALLAAMLAALAPTTRLAISCGLTTPAAWSRMQSIAAWRRQPPTLPDRVPAVFAWLA